jgi:hypothetical protein
MIEIEKPAKNRGLRQPELKHDNGAVSDIKVL